MFELEKRITAWRQEMFRAGVRQPEVLDELESHLRNDFNALISSGKTESEALQLALSRMGKPLPLQAEFKKLEGPLHWQVKAGFAFWLAAVITFAAVFLFQRIKQGNLDLLFFAHAFTYTAGYGAAFLVGSFAWAAVYHLRFRLFSAADQRALARGIAWSAHLAAALVLVGFVLGALYIRPLVVQHKAFRFEGGNLRLIAAGCATAWIVGLSLMHLLGRLSQGTAIRLSIVGNVVVSLAWFVPHIALHYDSTPDFTLGFYWLLVLYLAINFIFLALAILPPRERLALKS